MMGDRKRAIAIDEYIFAALNLYLDIINMFCECARGAEAMRSPRPDLTARTAPPGPRHAVFILSLLGGGQN